MAKLKVLARDWLPPAVIRWIRQKRGGCIRFEGDFATWEDASAYCNGYDAAVILAKVLDATLKVKAGDSVFERDSMLFNKVEYAWPVLTGLMWAAARNRGRLNVLDFGGALGSSFFQYQKFLQTQPELHWNIVEQVHYVEAGREHIQDNQLRFYKTIEHCLSENKPNVVLLSSALQYLKSPFDIIQRMASVGADCLIIDRTPFSSGSEDKVVIQRVPTAIYAASYPMWVFSYSEFMNKLNLDWNLVASNICPEGCVQSTEGYNFSFQGMLLEPRQ